MRKPEDILAIVGFEESQAITIALRKLGVQAYSCDLKECSGGYPEYHIQGDIFEVVNTKKWDLGIFHPVCKYMAVSGLHWNKRVDGRAEKTAEALNFVRRIMAFDILHMAIENPVSCISSQIRKPDQIIQPYEYGADASKKTCLWLTNLPKLKPTERIAGRMVNGKERWGNQTDSGQNKLAPSPDRDELRSKTYPGVAEAIAEQWTEYILKYHPQSKQLLMHLNHEER